MAVKDVPRHLLLLTFTSLLLAKNGMAATIQVPAQQPSIQAAIDASTNGDTIRVAPGTYRENLNFHGKAVVLVSTGGVASTVIDGGTSDYTMTFQSGEGASTVVSSFTFKNGRGSFANSAYVLGASPTLTDNVFEGSIGRSIWANSSSLLLQRNLFSGWNPSTGSLNAAVVFVNGSSPSIKDNVFVDNRGAALDLTLPTGYSPDVANNTIVNNDVGIQVDARVNANLHLYRNNVVSGNGVGFVVSFGSPGDYPTLQNNLVFGNTSNFVGFPDQTGSNGNISEDPKLGGLSVPDFHPDDGSPLIDAGLNAAASVGETDFYGGQRIQTGTSGSAVLDIGGVEFSGAPPTVSLSSSAATAILGETITLTWSSSNASSCVASGAWSGALALGGSRVVTPPRGSSSYKITCSNASASRARLVPLTVYGPPIVSISGAPASIVAGGTFTLTWSTVDATACTKTGDWSGSAPVSGSLLVGATLAGTFTYTLSCTGVAGTTANSVSVTVIPRPQITLTFAPAAIPVGSTSTMTWTSTATTSCMASGSWSGAQPTNGSMTVGPFPAGFYSYGLSCTGPGGSTSNTQGLTVFVQPTVTISVTPAVVAIDSPFTISWSSTNANFCAAPGWLGDFLPPSATLTSRRPTSGSVSFPIVCSNSQGGSAIATATVTVYGQPTASLAITPSSITAGTTATLTWTSAESTGCTASGTWSGAVALTGSQALSQTSAGTYVYNLSCTNPAGGSVTATASLSVSAPTPPVTTPTPPVTIPTPPVITPTPPVDNGNNGQPSSGGGGSFGLLELGLLGALSARAVAAKRRGASGGRPVRRY